jgi:DNA-binding HxlR family transcriptional regulator
MTDTSYKQFCPIAMASEIIATRWTLLLLRELFMGSERFNDLRRGLPAMSPALLSKRLKELEEAGIVTRTPAPRDRDVHLYHLTEAGQALRPIVEAVGAWGKTWVSSKATLQNLDSNLLMWDIHRNINIDPLPRVRTVISFLFSDQKGARGTYWLVVEPDEGVDLCLVDPGFEVDLYVSTDLHTLTAVWQGYASFTSSMCNDKLVLTGDRQLADTFMTWMKLSPFAPVKQRA